MRYDDDMDAFESDGFGGESGEGSEAAPWEEAPRRRLSRREMRKKRKLEEKLHRLEAKNAARGGAAGSGYRSAADDQTGPERQAAEEDGPRRRSKLGEALTALMTGSILSSEGVTKTYPYLVFVAFLAFLYIANIFSMQQLHRQQATLTREVRELRTKSMTIASECMQATRQSNIIREIERRGIPLRESLEPNRVIPE